MLRRINVWDEKNVEERRDPAVCSVGECCASAQCQRSPQLGNISLLQIQNTKYKIRNMKEQAPWIPTLLQIQM